MSNELDKFFYELAKNLEFLNDNPDKDNEANRHRLLVDPFLTNPQTLNWDKFEIVPEKSLKIEKELKESYIFPGAEPISKRPDITIIPHVISKPVAIVKEKERQKSIEKLKTHSPQLAEYQQLHDVVWGLLTDGEKWILKKNWEEYQQFTNLDELKKNIKDLQTCIGKEALITRYLKYNTTDLVKVVPPPSSFIISAKGYRILYIDNNEPIPMLTESYPIYSVALPEFLYKYQVELGLTDKEFSSIFHLNGIQLIEILSKLETRIKYQRDSTDEKAGVVVFVSNELSKEEFNRLPTFDTGPNSKIALVYKTRLMNGTGLIIENVKKLNINWRDFLSAAIDLKKK